MDSNQETDNFEDLADLSEVAESDDGSTSVDDFIKQLEEKEKDLHITAETTFIEIAAGFDEDNGLSDFTPPKLAENGKKTIQPVVPSPSQLETSLRNEVAALNAKLVKIEAERSEMFAYSQRRTKDFEALKTRTERERNETFQNQLSILATKMLPSLDNLNRALAFASAMPQKKGIEFQQFFEGIVLVNQQINEVLAGMGLQTIPAMGELFDPHLHEAVAIEEISDLPPNTISEELLRGYSIGGKVIRHSMVKVARPAQSAEPTVYGDIDFSDSADPRDETSPTINAVPNALDTTPATE